LLFERVKDNEMAEYSLSMQYVIAYLLKPGSYNAIPDLLYRRQPAELGQDIGGVLLSEGSEVFEAAFLSSGKILYPWRPACVRGEIGSPTTIYADPVIGKFFVCFIDPSRFMDIFSRRPRKIEARAFSSQQLLDLLSGHDNDDKPEPPRRRRKKSLIFTSRVRDRCGSPLPQPV